MNSAVLGYISGVMVLVNVGLAAFVAAAPDHSLPWYVLAAVAALNAVVHALPSSGVSVTGPASKPNA